MRWEELDQKARNRIINRTDTIFKRLIEKGYIGPRQGGRGLLGYGNRLNKLMDAYEREIKPSAGNIWVSGLDSPKVFERGQTFLKMLLRAMHVMYGTSDEAWRNCYRRAVEWLENHGEKIPAAVWEDIKKFEASFEPKDNVVENESQLYEKVAQWIAKDIGLSEEDEVYYGNIHSPLKWGNPDVVGVRKLEGKPSYVIAAEVKNTISTRLVFEGFGQACAYKLFSHMQYLVIPADVEEETLMRLKSLCRKVQVRLVVFTAENPEKITFTLEEGAKDEPPDPKLMKEFLEKLRK